MPLNKSYGNTLVDEGKVEDDDQIVFGTDDDFHWEFNSSNTELRLVNASTTNVVLSIDVADDVLDVQDDASFPGITGSPTFSGHDHTSTGMTAIPNSGLVNDSVTITSGDGLKNGGSVSLGNSTTLDIEPADFAGTFLSDDGADNLTVDLGNGVENDGSGNIRINPQAIAGNALEEDTTTTLGVVTDGIQTDELDLSITPTWTGAHTFDGGITMGGDIDMQSTHQVENLPAPTQSDHAARKGYVDSIEQGLDLKDSVVAATDGTNIDLTSTTDPNPIDGVTLDNGDRVLLKDQTTASENGIYDAVTATDPTTWVRSADADEDSEVNSGMFTFVEQGTNNANEGWVLTTSDPITVGTTDLAFTQFSGAGQINAGDGLDKSGDTLSVDVSDFAGSGIQDDGGNDLELTNDSLTVNTSNTSDSGLSGGGTVSLGGSTTIDFDPSGVDAASLDGSDGTDGQVLTTTGSTAQWEDPAGTNVIASGTVTASGGASPALDTTITNVSTNQTLQYDFRLYVDSDPSWSSAYAFNYDWGHSWDNANSQVDINLTVNWDTDPGSGDDLTLRWELYA